MITSESSWIGFFQSRFTKDGHSNFIALRCQLFFEKPSKKCGDHFIPRFKGQQAKTYSKK